MPANSPETELYNLLLQASISELSKDKQDDETITPSLISSCVNLLKLTPPKDKEVDKALHTHLQGLIDKNINTDKG